MKIEVSSCDDCPIKELDATNSYYCFIIDDEVDDYLDEEIVPETCKLLTEDITLHLTGN